MMFLIDLVCRSWFLVDHNSSYVISGWMVVCLLVKVLFFGGLTYFWRGPDLRIFSRKTGCAHFRTCSLTSHAEQKKIENQLHISTFLVSINSKMDSRRVTWLWFKPTLANQKRTPPASTHHTHHTTQSKKNLHLHWRHCSASLSLLVRDFIKCRESIENNIFQKIRKYGTVYGMCTRRRYKISKIK